MRRRSAQVGSGKARATSDRARASLGFVSTTTPSLGLRANLNGWLPFPSDNWWNTRIDGFAVSANSTTYINRMEVEVPSGKVGFGDGFNPDSPWYGIPFYVVDNTTPDVAVTFTTYPTESDPGPYPLPSDIYAIEGYYPGVPAPGAGTDRHVCVYHRDRQILYELNGADFTAGVWTARNGAKWDCTQNLYRTAGWTSGDAAGLALFPGIAKAEEVLAGEITHALRMTLATAAIQFRKYVKPGSHATASNPNDAFNASRPPMSARMRLKASFSETGYSVYALRVIKCLKRYGVYIADNGGHGALQAAGGTSWPISVFNELSGNIPLSQFEFPTLGWAGDSTIYTTP